MCLLFCYCVIQGVSFNYHHRNVRSRVSVSVSNFQVSVSAFMTKSRPRSRLEIWARPRSRSRSRRLRSRLRHCEIHTPICLANLWNRFTTKIFDIFRIITLKQQKFSQSDPVLTRQFSKKLQSDPVLIRPKLASVLIQSDLVLIRVHRWCTEWYCT